ncbi:MAG: DNA repair protein RecN [Deltaproteobacteria bacterium RBG_13_43_22]|nr:MAG: DNA repair protein RecN [Deltaproteobacteria bacterium RBG_13_43_22]
MLDQLQIVNLALIDRVTLSFSNGLNILSGETGAGKSIIVKAVNLLLGEKPSPDTIRQGAEEARVEALFTLTPDHSLQGLLESLGLPAEEQILIKRTVQPGGKSRAWINGSLTNLSTLSRITRSLIGISNQHEYQSLLNPVQHLYLLDRFAGLLPLREEVQNQFSFLEERIHAWQELKDQEQKRKSQKDLWLFQAQEIQQADLRSGEDQELQQRKRVLLQAEKIWEKIHQAQQTLFEEEHSCLNTLSLSKDLIRSVVSIDPSLQPLFKEVDTLQVHLMEIITGLRDYLSRLIFDPQILEQVEERLDRIQRLTAKYGSTVEEVLDYGEQIEKNLKEGEDQVYRLKGLEDEIQAGRKRLFETSMDLSRKRKKAALDLTSRIEEQLKGLGMGGCQFQMIFSPGVNEQEADENYRFEGTGLSRTGIEKGEFYIAPNLGEGLRPLARIASGGELSRILLVLKGLLSDQDSLETLIFDEVDSGIGGSLGESVGRKLSQLSQTHQVVCITHLPQIAAFAETHFQLFKETRARRTQTRIRLLQEEEQVEEMARMLGGSSSSAKTVSVAREMLSRAKKQRV